MKRIFMTGVMIIFGIINLNACGPAGTPVVVVPTATPQLVVVKVLPTPISPGEMITYDDLQVVMVQAEITGSYQTEYGSTREPPAGFNFIWIHITLKNMGQSIRDVPASEHFSLLYEEKEFKPIYGHRLDHPDYFALPSGMFQDQVMDAWLRFDIPAALGLKDLWFVFLPTGTQVSVGFSTTDSPWGDQPIYLWSCSQ